MNNSDKNPEKSQYERFLRLLRLNEKKIYGHILSLIPKRDIAEDIMQDAIVIMWRKFSDFKEDSNFSAWGITIGRFLVMDYFRKEGRSAIHFISEALENIGENTDVFDTYSDQMEALSTCLKKLPENSRQILRLRYQQGNTIKEIADQIGKPIHSMYKLVAKIHSILQQCIERNLSALRGDL
jgi:RNA polymerase sigma-70 factor (ECF subfamily)